MAENRQSEQVKALASRLGFQSCGIAKASFLSQDARRLEQWLTKGYHGEMQYMERNFDLRTDPRKLVPEAKSVITLLFNYYPEAKQKSHAPKISKYAFGKDYHLVIREKLNEFLYELRKEFGEVAGRGFVDSAPVLERSWAVQSGLGWVGKNGNLLQKGTGSFFFIATLITDLQLSPDDIYATDHCGTCTRCIDACPTEAIVSPTIINATKCISYLTIELKDALLPSDMKGQLDGWAFGCDVCQDVCPWNKFATPHAEKSLEPYPAVLDMSKEEWEQLNEDLFKQIFRKSAIKRATWKGMLRNIEG